MRARYSAAAILIALAVCIVVPAIAPTLAVAQPGPILPHKQTGSDRALPAPISLPSLTEEKKPAEAPAPQKQTTEATKHNTFFAIKVIIIACGLPAWRAARVDPMAALRNDG